MRVLTSPSDGLAVMVADSQTQGVLSQKGASRNGALNGTCQTASAKIKDCVTVESPSHISEFFPKNTLGCSDGRPCMSFS